MKRLIIILVFQIFIVLNLNGFNKMVVNDYGFYNIVTAGAFEDDSISIESVIYNPSLISFNKTGIDISYVHKNKNPFIDTVGFLGLNANFNNVGYSLYLSDNKVFDDESNMYNLFNLGFAIRKRIGGIVPGVGIRYYKTDFNGKSSTSENLQYSIGVKRRGKFASKNNLTVSLSYNSSINFSWDNDFVPVKSLPSQVFFSLGLNRDDFYIFFRLNYIFPVVENLNSNYSYVINDDEIRFASGFMYDSYLFNYLDVKFLVGYKYIDENTNIVASGVSVAVVNGININIGGESSSLISDLNYFDKIVGGMNFYW